MLPIHTITLPLYTITWVLGLALGSFLSSFPFTITTTLMIAAAGLTYAEVQGRLPVRRSLLLFTCLLTGCLYWTVAACRQPHVSIPDDRPASATWIEGRVVEPARHAPHRLTALVEVTATDDPSIPTPFRLRLTWRDPDSEVSLGSTIRVRAQVHAPVGSLNPRGFDYAAYLDQQGIDAVASASGAGAVFVQADKTPSLLSRLSRVIERGRARIRSAAQELPEPARGLFLSLTIGDQGYLTPEVREWFMATGTVHILSISGSHLGLIAWLTFTSVRKGLLLLPSLWLLTLSRRLTATRAAVLVTMVPVAAYTWLAGAETATIRSCLMIAVALWTVWQGSTQYLLHALAAVAGVTLLVHPTALYDISFQLSYLSVWVLALALPVMEVGHETADLAAAAPTMPDKLLRWVRESLRLTALVTLATLPLVAWYFNQVAWLGVAANLIVVPFVGLLFLPISLLSVLWCLVTGSDSLVGAGVIESSAQALVSAVHGLAGLPGAEWFVAAPTLPTMLLFYGLGWMLLTGRPMVNPWRRRAMEVGLVALVAWWLWSPRPFPRDGRVQVTVLDVGQGDSTVLELPSGDVVVIDGGATYERFDMGRGVVAPFLWNRGIRRVDHVVATHPQLDHAGGLGWIVAHMPVGRFWTNGDTRPEEFWRKIEATLVSRRIPTTTATEGMVVTEGDGCRLTVLNPPARHTSSAAGKQDSLNNRSIVTELVCGPQRLLFTGDVERETLARLRAKETAGHVTLVKVPHHGALSSLEQGWIGAVKPDIAIVSAGRRNPYGHPVESVLAAYRAAGSQVLRTDRDGAVRLVLDAPDGRPTLHRTRDGLLQPAWPSARPWAVEAENYRRLWNRWTWN